MRTITRRRALSGATVSLVLALVTACETPVDLPEVASVQMTTTYSNPRVGEVANVTAIPVDAGGVRVQGVGCTFTSSVPAVGSVDPSTGTVTALSAGTTVITGTCADKANTITITVRPRLVTLTINKTGAGSGSVFATPAGSSFDQGTSLSVQATAASGSAFTGWSGACVGTTNPCTLLMDGNKTVTADFTNSETFKNSAAFGGAMTTVVDGSCRYTVRASVTNLTLTVVTAANGTITGTGTSSTDFTVTGNSGSCQGNPYTASATGAVTGSGTSVNATLTRFSQTYQAVSETITVTGTRSASGTTITGTARIQEVLRNGAGQAFNSAGTFSFTLTRQP